VETLLRTVTDQALEICGEEDRIRREIIGIAPLQISKQFRNMEELKTAGHFHYRKDMVRVFDKPCSDVIPHDQIFEVAEQHARSSVEKCTTDEAKSKHVLKIKNLVFISGQAGIGKTTLSKELVKQMLDENVRLYQAEFVFYIRLRDLDFEKNQDLLQLLTASAQPLSNITSEERKSVIQYLEACDNVCIVMDGLDEAILDLGMKIYADCDVIGQQATTATLVLKLISGRLLPKARKLVTSRPRKLLELPEEYSSNLYLDLLGLSDEGQQQICRDICRGDHDRKDKILSRINNRPDLKNLCYVPIICIMIMISFYHTDSLGSNVVTLTAILVNALENWFLKKLNKFKIKFQIKEISIMAFEGFMSSRFYFREHHLKAAKLNFENTTTFLINNIKFELLQGKAVTYFAHLMWQNGYAFSVWTLQQTNDG